MENKKSFLILSKIIDFLHKLCYNNNCQEGCNTLIMKERQEL